MDSKISSQLTSLHLLLTLECLLLYASANPREFFDACGPTFSCGPTITRVGYPFRGSHDPPFCGHPSLVLTCDDTTNSTTIQVMNTAYRVLGINSTEQTMRIVREDIMEAGCPREIANATLDLSIFEYYRTYANLSFFYGCPGLSPNPGPCGDYITLPGYQSRGNCSSVVIVSVEGNVSANATSLDQVLRQGFTVKWKIDGRACDDCMKSRGRCGFDFGDNRTTCFCVGPPYVSNTCHDTSLGVLRPKMMDMA